MSDGVKYHVCVSVFSDSKDGWGRDAMSEVGLVTKDDYNEALAVAERIADLVNVLKGKEKA